MRRKKMLLYPGYKQSVSPGAHGLLQELCGCAREEHRGAMVKKDHDGVQLQSALGSRKVTLR